MIIKIVKITHCNECPHCGFDMDSGDSKYWGKYYCQKLKFIIVNPDEDIPQECPLENAGY